MLDLMSEDVRRDPYPLYARLRRDMPLLHEPAADVWMVFDYEHVRRTLTDHETFSSRAAPPGGQPLDWLIFQDPPRQTKLRALIQRAFTPRAVSAMEPRIHALASGLLDVAMTGERMDVAVDFAVPLPIRVIAEMIGIPFEDRPRFQRWSDAILGLSDTLFSGGRQDSPAVQVYRAATADMRTYVAELSARRRAEPADDLLTRLVEAEVDGERLSEGDLLGFFQLLLVAGSETTTNLIGNAVLCFAEDSTLLPLLHASPALLPTFIEEVLRYRAPVHVMFRRTTRPVEMHGRIVPADRLVLAMIGSANRDPLAFADADRLDPTRDPNPHIAFGHGVHFCLGAALARLEGRVALSLLLERVRHVELTSESPWEPRKAFHVHGPTRLPMRFSPAASRRQVGDDVVTRG
jgi:cytochrome P450